MSFEYFEVSAKNLITYSKVLTKSDSNSENVIGLTPEYITKMMFDNCKYDIISNSQEHHLFLKELFGGKTLLLKFNKGTLYSWNVLMY